MPQDPKYLVRGRLVEKWMHQVIDGTVPVPYFLFVAKVTMFHAFPAVRVFQVEIDREIRQVGKERQSIER